MIRVKKKNYQNLLIVLLFVVLIFLLGRIFVRTNIFETQESNNTIVLDDLSFKFFIDDVFFPIETENNIKNASKVVKSIYSFLARTIFSVDIREPVTFVQTQFATSILYKNSEVYASNWNSEENKSPERDKKLQDANLNSEEIIQVNAVSFKEDGRAEYDEDDLGEESEGIYLIRDNKIIDSIENSDAMNLQNIKLPAKITFHSNLPQILIYHTHGTEAYKPASEGNFHTLKKEYSVFVVGEILTRELEKRGFNVIHDVMYHNYPSFGGSYRRSLARAEEILEANPSIKVILDVHRDGFNHIHLNPNINSIIKNNQVEINGETSSKFQVVIGSETPNRNEVENFAELVKTVSNSLFPGFAKPILTKPYGRFNQFLADHYLLLEVGTNANTIEEARRAAYHLADVLATSLKAISNNY